MLAVNVLLLIIGLGVAYGIYLGLQFGFATDAPLRVVVSGSMIPKYQIGDVVVVKGVGVQFVTVFFFFDVPVQGVSAAQIRNGTDIIFWFPFYSSTDPIVHEVIRIIPNSPVCKGDVEFITHGINNPRSVTEMACGSPNDGSPNYVIGEVTGSIPYIGNVSFFLKSGVGFALVIVLIVILVAVEVFEPQKNREPKTIESG